MLTLSDLSCDTDRRLERIFLFNSDPAQPIEVPHPTSYPPKTSERSLETRKTYQKGIMGSEHLPNPSKTLMKVIKLPKFSKIYQNVKIDWTITNTIKQMKNYIKKILKTSKTTRFIRQTPKMYRTSQYRKKQL